MRGGKDYFHPPDREGREQHTFEVVYKERILEICRCFPGLPDPRSMTIDEIDFFYDGIAPTLKEATAPKPKK